MIYFCEYCFFGDIIFQFQNLFLNKKQKKIVLIGGPGTGKTSVINELNNRGFCCFQEISREVTLEAQKKGIAQLFLTDPILFSKLLLEGREQQFLEADANKKNIVFFDRAIPDIIAYLKYTKTNYPSYFDEKSKKYNYNIIFHFKPWKKIHTTDNERYESFSETQKIDTFLKNTYENLGYKLINVPFGTIKDRVNFILNTIASF